MVNCMGHTIEHSPGNRLLSVLVCLTGIKTFSDARVAYEFTSPHLKNVFLFLYLYETVSSI